MMNEDRDRDDEPIGDLWFTNWEQQCIQHLENEPDYEGQIINDRDLATQKAWCCFQNSAASIAQLYKDRLQDVSTLWVPFQTAAGTVATLYKESTDAIRRHGEIGTQCGYQRRNKELLNWARKRRRNIRREDLISYLAGKPLPPRPHHTHRMSPLPRLVMSSHSGNSHQGGAHHLSVADANATAMDENLHMFREALAISGGGGSRKHRSAELSAFISGEFARHCQAVKRPMPSPPPHDVNMDSPTHPKRPRYM
uniref:Uncharacterized protein n=1 Tax=Graphocephala atropunctata TaxID=36148 RepID=A0A1B6KV06_9HEMI